jgi:hypothetical protein
MMSQEIVSINHYDGSKFNEMIYMNNFLRNVRDYEGILLKLWKVVNNDPFVRKPEEFEWKIQGRIKSKSSTSWD